MYLYIYISNCNYLYHSISIYICVYIFIICTLYACMYIYIHLDESWPHCDVRWMMVRIVGNHPQMTLFEISALLWFIQRQCMHMRYILLFLFPRITFYFRFVIYSIFSNLLRCLGMFPWVFRQCWFFFASKNVEPLVAFFAFQKSRNLAHLGGGDRGFTWLWLKVIDPPNRM